jgi:hypothetical protein
MVSKMVYGPVLHAARLMKFLSVRKGGLKGERVRSQPIRPLNIGGNEFAPASAVKEDLTCSGSSLPKKKGGPARVVRKRTSPQAHKLSSLTMNQYPLLWDFIRLNRKRNI